MLTLPQTIEQDGAENRRELDRLLAGVAAGDRDALARLYRLTRTAVYGLALSYMKNPQDAQDVAQDAFVRIWDSAPQYQSQGSPMGWILTVTRSRGREAGLEEEQWLAIPANAPSVSPEDRALLEQALGTLEEQSRRIVLLHAVTGLKHREIAQLLELPLATVLSKYHRALKKLKAQLEGDDVR